ncbi:hypothetical protein ACPA9J_04385 [Pseudomonas aeruginosa]
MEVLTRHRRSGAARRASVQGYRATDGQRDAHRHPYRGHPASHQRGAAPGARRP